MYRLYNVLLTISALFAYLSVPLLSLSSKKNHDAMLERLGFYTNVLPSQQSVWIQAASVGEVLIAAKIISTLRASHPDLPIVLSATTSAGKDMATEKLASLASIIHFPLDFKRAVRRAFTAIDPFMFIMVETELWPNLLRYARQNGVPCMIVNGRISDRSYRKYRFARPLFADALESVATACMSSGDHARRIQSLGLADGKIKVTGNIKFDLSLSFSEPDPDSLKKLMGIDDEMTVFIAGSTAEGEEDVILNSYLQLKSQCQKPVLIIAPRHMSRVTRIEKILEARDLGFSKLSSLKMGKTERPFDIIIVDTIGDLIKIYSFGRIIFVGGSLVPSGGHNIIEPALYGKPILFGNHMENFREIADTFIEHGAGFMVHNGAELTRMMFFLLQNREAYDAAGAQARRIVEENSGALNATISEITRILSER